MSIDKNTVKRVARLARLSVTEDEAENLKGELNSILNWVEMLNEVDVEGVQPMTSVVNQEMRKRKDAVTDGNYADRIVANAPMSEDNYFMVPKVIE
ncbi:Asp-tRNA(Asn)/Glu-tRNA(Gln) amidotransferase subunit GatC [Cohaesibacter celericrescens]|uniref:Aspartyl/glutamyl-tRNA(Asn/Gln) amidotransferase subunit C n=1 Tax=Cohaesibacter celericrescens TaxID=2067669 RepID=A0A2N5XS19_9HYPH|nr:Asp-tRNA(Asn)/Glu-tRNA(Gln) amidotransferase subunit GatC [Cohaesibacter celericrescens]PLW77321.1 Asp-tRNA(Asn)/Glu-tRNA(Gln) amidotransferase GatCAB subunit C [Cohaesibacter celericrescens]